MNALDLLQRDHSKLRNIINNLNSTWRNDTNSRYTLIQQLKEEYKEHEYLEDKLFYSVLAEYPETRDFIKQSYREHRQIDKILTALEDIDSHRDEWKTKLAELQANLFLHMEQEEQILFPKARKLLGKEAIEEMGIEMVAVKDPIML